MSELQRGKAQLITGATGNIGSRVVEGLIRRGERPRVFVRDADKARRLFGDRVDTRAGDLADPASLSRAAHGVDVVFLVTAGPDLAEKDKALAEAVRAAGVRLLVKLSTVDVAHNVGTGPWHRDGEAAIRDAGVEFVFVQPSGFMDNLLKWADSIKTDAIVRCCAGDGRMPFIHSEDIAAVAIEAMTNPRYVGQSLPITGPEPLSFADMTAQIGASIGRKLRFCAISDEEERQQQSAWSTPGPLIEARLGIFRAIRSGQLAEVTTNVASMTGREPFSFAQWAKENATTFQ